MHQVTWPTDMLLEILYLYRAEDHRSVSQQICMSHNNHTKWLDICHSQKFTTSPHCQPLVTPVTSETYGNRVTQSSDNFGTGVEWQPISIGKMPKLVVFVFVACAIPQHPFVQGSNLQITRLSDHQMENIVGDIVDKCWAHLAALWTLGIWTLRLDYGLVD